MSRARDRVGAIAVGASLALLAAGLGGVGVACGSGGEQPSPSITAQGFAIDDVQTAIVGSFAPVKVRIEAPAGIEALRVRERSYEVDLAKSPETAHLPLFGLERRVWSRPDVTLDFAPYANAKLVRAGRYEFDVLVRDRRDATATATLVMVVETPATVDEAEPSPPGPAESTPGVDVSAPPAAASRGDALRLAPFRLERVGASAVRGGEEIGIDWKTLEPIDVTIRVTGAGPRTRLARLPAGEFAAIETRGELMRALREGESVEHLDLATANDAAAGAVFAMLTPDAERPALLRADESRTSLSVRGTTVTLVGQIKR